MARHAPPPGAAPMVVILLAAPMLAGCIEPQGDPGTPAPDGPDAAADLAAFLDGARLAILSAGDDPFGPARVRITVTGEPAPHDRTLTLAWDMAGARGRTPALVPGNETTAAFIIEQARPPGDHPVSAWVEERPVLTAETTIRVWAPVTLVLNASEQYASGQNPFQNEHVIPFAPWINESALDVLQRAADQHRFALRTQYDPSLESHFVDMINGTAFRWEVEPAGISRNWMLLVDGTAGDRAADDTLPTVGQTVEYRYVRCYATGQCDDL